jgi:molybdopterin-containing oxidoreductase family membrane subunit
MDAIARILVFISLIMGTSYMAESFIGWYSGNHYEMSVLNNRLSGDYNPQFWIMVVCNALIPQLFWFKKIRRNWVWLLAISLVINVGMWYERYNIVVPPLSKDFLPANWTVYNPTVIDVGVYMGTVGLFAMGVLLFMRYIPMMAISELKGVVDIGKKRYD